MALRFTVQYPLAHPGYDPAFLTPAAMRTFLRAADEAGFDAIGFTEHPAPSHKWVRSGGHDTLDPLAALSFAAAVTDRIKLLTYTLLLPLRNPLLLAKSIGTVDVISAGRLVLGVGAGYLRSEFAALGADFGERNELFDESVEAMIAAFAQEGFAFEGRHFKAIGQTIRPRPVQQPHPPFWVGGNSRTARRRAARYGEAWMPLLIGEGMGQVIRTAPIPDATALDAAVRDLRQLEAEAGRPPGSVDVQVEGLCGQMAAPTEVILERLGEVSAAGATWVVLDPPGQSVAGAVESLQRYAEEIIPTVRWTRTREEGPTMATVDDTLDQDNYDEFSLLHENAEEWDIPFDGTVAVSRESILVGGGNRLSYIKWGTADPEVVYLHGGGQNGHTWDSVALALGRPAVAVDLPGHGRSYRRDDGNYGPWNNVIALEEAIPEIAPNATVVVGMSLGGATTIHFAAKRPDLCRNTVIVDVTPQVNDPARNMSTMERGSVALIGGPPTYESFEAMADAAVALSPYRAASGVRRGVRHNAYKRADGLWTWRYDLFGRRAEAGDTSDEAAPAPREDIRHWSDFTSLWKDVSAIKVPAMLVRGGESKFVTDDDEAELVKRLRSVRVESVPGAGHAVQSDRPLVLVGLIDDFTFGDG